MSVSLALAAALAAAQPPAPAAAPRPSTTVGEVVVPGGPAPKMTGSWPAPDGSVAAGVLTVKLVFDQTLDEKTPVRLVAAAGGASLECLKTPRLLADAKTLVVLCRTAPRTSYDLAVDGVVSAAGRPAAPAGLKFASTSEVVDNASDALKAAGLTNADEPIEAWAGAEIGAPSPPAAGPAPAPHPPTQN